VLFAVPVVFFTAKNAECSQRAQRSNTIIFLSFKYLINSPKKTRPPFLFHLQKPFMKKILPLLIFPIMLACNSENKEQPTEAKATVVFDLQKAKAFIDSINLKFSEAALNGDSNWLASQYGPDAEILMENSETIKAKDILSFWGGSIRSGLKYFTFTTTDLQGDENFLIETGGYEIKDASKKLVYKGKYVVVWKKQNGEWKLYRDMAASSPIGAK
jgi:ketosteroid isomerase-like protein